MIFISNDDQMARIFKHMLNMYIDGKYSHLMSLRTETAIMSVYEISSLFFQIFC